MNKKEIRKLTWEYFWQQKINEISIFTAISLLVVFIPHLVGKIIVKLFTITECYWVDHYMDCGLRHTWLYGVGTIFIFSLITFIIVWVLRKWISSNWDKAETRAKEEYNKKFAKGRKDE